MWTCNCIFYHKSCHKTCSIIHSHNHHLFATWNKIWSHGGTRECALKPFHAAWMWTVMDLWVVQKAEAFKRCKLVEKDFEKVKHFENVIFRKIYKYFLFQNVSKFYFSTLIRFKICVSYLIMFRKMFLFHFQLCSSVNDLDLRMI